MTYEVVGLPDNIDGRDSFGVRVVDDEEMHEVTFTRFDTGEYIPTTVHGETTDGADLDFIFNGGLATACDNVCRQLEVTVPFNQPGFQTWRP